VDAVVSTGFSSLPPNHWNLLGLLEDLRKPRLGMATYLRYLVAEYIRFAQSSHPQMADAVNRSFLLSHVDG